MSRQRKSWSGSRAPLWALGVLLASVLLAACEPGEKARLRDFRELGELRVATRHDTLSYHVGPDGDSSGFEHDLLLALGEQLGVPVRFKVLPNSASALRAIERGDVHMAAAGLVRNPRATADWTSPVRPVDYVVVGSSAVPPIADPSQLAGRRIGVRHASVPAETLHTLRKRVPNVSLVYPRSGGEGELLERVATGELDYAATDTLNFQILAKYHPTLQVAMSLQLRSDIAWAINPAFASSLTPEVETFLAESRRSGLFDRVAERHFGHVQRLDRLQVSMFLERMQTRLPRYRALFIEAARMHGLDWRLLAAVSYQESQWNPTATSPTGVRGLMMLTAETAGRLGVRDRLDARESIMGGARYLAMLRDGLPAATLEPDRTWMAVAAYNVGSGHLRGARAIARSLAKDPHSWAHMKRVLPLIAQPAYAARLAAGAGRGGEAVIMTESVRNYFDILVRHEPAGGDAAMLPQALPAQALPAQGVSNSSPRM